MAKMTKETRIKKRQAELRQVYAKLPDKKMAIAIPLINNAAFMEVELDDLQKIIAANGASEEYKNGENQYGKKASADLQAYNSLIKSYNAVNTRLEAMLKDVDTTEQSALQALMDE